MTMGDKQVPERGKSSHKSSTRREMVDFNPRAMGSSGVKGVEGECERRVM